MPACMTRQKRLIWQMELVFCYVFLRSKNPCKLKMTFEKLMEKPHEFPCENMYFSSKKIRRFVNQKFILACECFESIESMGIIVTNSAWLWRPDHCLISDPCSTTVRTHTSQCEIVCLTLVSPIQQSLSCCAEVKEKKELCHAIVEYYYSSI